MAPPSSIPSVDLSPFFVEEGVAICEAPTPAQQKCANDIDAACREHGFLHVTGFGLTSDLNSRAFAASEQLFGRSEKTKLNDLRRWNPSHNMGYSPLASESTNSRRPPELKEAFNVRFAPSHTNDYRGCPPSFVQVSEELQQVMRNVAHRYALACALALKLPIDYFSQTVKDMNLCTIRFLHYPPCDIESTSSESTEKPIRVGEHTDFGAFTFLLLGDHGPEGLQIKLVEGGEVGGAAGDEFSGWHDVVLLCKEGAIVNTGALMARWTNDEWRATAHRVVVPSKVEAARSRFSIAFFVDPDEDAMVEVHESFVTETKPSRYRPITGSAYLQMKLSEMANPLHSYSVPDVRL